MPSSLAAGTGWQRWLRWLAKTHLCSLEAYASQMVMKWMLRVSINKCRSSLPDGIMGYMITEVLSKTVASEYTKLPSVQNYSFCDEQQISCSYWLHSPLKM